MIERPFCLMRRLQHAAAHAKSVGFACVCQLASGAAALPPNVGVVDETMRLPFIIHSASAPLSLRQRMSVRASRLKSPISTTCQLASGATTAPPEVIALLDA